VLTAVNIPGAVSCKVLPALQRLSDVPANSSTANLCALVNDKIPFGAVMNKAVTIRTGQTHVPRYQEKLLKKIEDGEIDPSFVITHRRRLADGPELYETFREKEDGCIKVVLNPWEAMSDSDVRP
jgi:threonine dehydrogenase-like Zn-dependent dehydrogenase